MINKDQVCEMRKLGFTMREIAERLGCSYENIKLHCKKCKKTKKRPKQFRRRLRKDEPAEWRKYYERTGSYTRVAWMFGRTRQQVYDVLKPCDKNGRTDNEQD